MYARILKRMRDKVHQRQYVMAVHAEEEMDDDDLTIFDVESAVLTGSIIERQRDYATKEWKYLIRGESIDGSQIVVAVTKFGRTGKLVFITVYVE